jgi:integrase
MGISKRPDSPFWWYDFTVQGNRFRGSTETTARGDAEKVEAKLRSDALLGKLTNKKTEMTIDAAFGRYWLTHACELSSAEVTDWHLEAIKTAMKPTTTLSRITDNELAHAVAKWRGEGQSGATCNRRLTVFRAVLRMARDRWGAEVSMPNWKAHAQREAAKRDPHLSPAKAEELIANAAPHLRPAIRFSLLTGVRLANCIELDWSQIDLPGRVMRFMVKSKADGGKPLTVPISGDLLALLVSLGPQQEGPVFTYQPRRRHGTLGPAVAIGSFRRRCARPGSRIFAGMICATSRRRGWCKAAHRSRSSRKHSGMRTSKPRCAMRTTRIPPSVTRSSSPRHVYATASLWPTVK